MKKSIPILFFFFVVFRLAAQPSPEQAKAAMKVFSEWPGIWKGETISWMGRTQKNSTVEENIQSKLDGTVIQFEGTGKAEDPTTHEMRTVHNALGLLSYNAASKEYNLKSYLADGRSTDAWFTIIGENRYQWGFDSGQGKIRYSITVNPAARTWNEVGEFSKDGVQYQKFFEMNLVKK